MSTVHTGGLLLRIFTPAAALSASYWILGHFCGLPHVLLFCILGTVLLVPIELGMILAASKKEYGTYSLQSALAGQKKLPLWDVLLSALLLFGFAGLLSAFAAPLEDQAFAQLRSAVLSRLPVGFDWTDLAYMKTFSAPMRAITCVYYGVFNVLAGPVTEELFFRGYLTSHYERQTSFTPVLIAILFSLYHFWLPFHNIFRILAFAPAAYAAYRKRNIAVSICFHCLCNLFSTVSYVYMVFA